MMARPSPDKDIAVLRVALDLAAVPSRRRQLRNSPLPEGVTFLLRIVTDDLGAIEASAKRMQKTRKSCVKRRRSTSNRSCWRRTPTAIACWARRSATAAELRRNFAFLCKWLHSELCQDMARSMFFLRVTCAWNNVKTPERRGAYDATLDARLAAPSVSRDEQAGDRKGNGKTKPLGGETSGGRGGPPRIVRARKQRWRASFCGGSSLSCSARARIERKRSSSTKERQRSATGFDHARIEPSLRAKSQRRRRTSRVPLGDFQHSRIGALLVYNFSRVVAYLPRRRQKQRSCSGGTSRPRSSPSPTTKSILAPATRARRRVRRNRRNSV